MVAHQNVVGSRLDVRLVLLDQSNRAGVAVVGEQLAILLGDEKGAKPEELFLRFALLF